MHSTTPESILHWSDGPLSIANADGLGQGGLGFSRHLAPSLRAGSGADAPASGLLTLFDGPQDALQVLSGAPTEVVLDLLEGIRTPGSGEGCERWPPDFLLRWQRGELSGYVRGRCKATNLCRYCQRLFVRETVEMLRLDALEYAPALWMVLTAREHLTRAQLTDHLRKLRKVVRREWRSAEWFVQVEFQKRHALHANLLIKGVPLEEARPFYEVTAGPSGLWCSRVDAEAGPFEDMQRGGQWLEPVNSGVGALLYISKILAHGLKAEQAPPIGWRGHRTSQTRGYLVRPASVMREEARESLRVRSTLARVQRDCPEWDAVEVHAAAEQLLLEEAEKWWTIIGPSTPARVEDLLDAGEICREGHCA